MIGLQGRKSPIIMMLSSLIEQEHRIGRVLSSSLTAFGGIRTRDTLSDG